MVERTPDLGLVYAGEEDYADVQDWYNLGISVDRQYRDDFRVAHGGARPQAWMFHTTTASSTFANSLTGSIQTLGGVTAVQDWNTSTGYVELGGGITTPLWRADAGDKPAWWMVGFSAFFTNTGTPANTDQVWMGLFSSSLDPITQLTGLRYTAMQTRNETLSGGEAMSGVGVIPMWRGGVTFQCGALGAVAGIRAVAAGARVWGVRLGDM